MVRDATTGKYRRTRLFVLTLGCSRKSVRLLTWRSSAKTGASCTSWPSGGSAARPRRGARQPQGRGAHARRLRSRGSTRSTATCSSTTARSRCRAACATPTARARSSRAIGHTQGTALKGLRFETIEDAQQHLDHWDVRWADTRIHGTTKRQVAAMFAEEKPHLLAAARRAVSLLPVRRRGPCTSTATSRSTARTTRRSAGHIGHVLSVQWDERRVRLLEHDDRRAAARARARSSAGGTARTKRTSRRRRRRRPTSCSRGHAAPAEHRRVAAEIHRRDGEVGRAPHRRAARHGEEARPLRRRRRVRAWRSASACRPTASCAGTWSARPRRALALKQIDPLIRDLTHYRDLIANITKETKNESDRT